MTFEQAARAESMSSAARGDLPPLSDHASFVFLPIRILQRKTLTEAELTLQDRLSAAASRGGSAPSAAAKPRDPLPWLPASERETLLAEGRRTRIWEPAPMNVGPDLYPHVRRMLGDAATSKGTNALCFRLADLPRRLLQGRSIAGRGDSEPGARDKQARSKLVLVFSAAARSRIAARLGGKGCDALELHIEHMQLVVYRTGFGTVIAQLSLRTLDGSPLPPYCLVEAVTSLARFNKLEWRHADGDAPALAASSPGDPTFTFSDIVSSFHAGENIGGTGRRLFTATYAQFARAPDPEARRHFALQLARHYSDDYRIAASIGGTCTVADFENVMHMVSMEGSATIIDLSPPPGLTVPDFVVNFKTATFDRGAGLSRVHGAAALFQRHQVLVRRRGRPVSRVGGAVRASGTHVEEIFRRSRGRPRGRIQRARGPARRHPALSSLLLFFARQLLDRAQCRLPGVARSLGLRPHADRARPEHGGNHRGPRRAPTRGECAPDQIAERIRRRGDCLR